MTPLLLLAACNQADNAPPPQILGLWQVHQVERTSGILDGDEVALARFPECVWARQTWRFGEGSIQVEHDVLCPANGGEYVACEVAAEVPARWDAEQGKWFVDHSVRARSRAVSLEPGSLEVPTSCTVEVAAGEYEVAKVPGEVWRWEMSIPNGNVLRLKIPDSDDPDFVMAIRELDADGEEAP